MVKSMPETYHLGWHSHHTIPHPFPGQPHLSWIPSIATGNGTGGLWRPPWNVANDVDFNHQWWRTGISWKARDKPPKMTLKWTMDVGLSGGDWSRFFYGILLGKIMVDHQILGVERVDQRWIGWRDHLQETTPYLVVEIRVSYMLSFLKLIF